MHPQLSRPEPTRNLLLFRGRLEKPNGEQLNFKSGFHSFVLSTILSAFAKTLIFVRDGILTVADYNSTLMGVVVVVVVVYFFTMG